MDEFQGRMTAIGLLAYKHADRISTAGTNPLNDKASLDLEVALFEGILRKKVEENEYFKKNWKAMREKLDALKDVAEKQAIADHDDESLDEVRDVAAERLAIRAEQFAILLYAAVEEGVLDVSELPHDDRRGRR